MKGINLKKFAELTDFLQEGFEKGRILCLNMTASNCFKLSKALWLTHSSLPLTWSGLAGLSAALYLAAAGHHPVLLEANEFLGGKVRPCHQFTFQWSRAGLHVTRPPMPLPSACLGRDDPCVC